MYTLNLYGLYFIQYVQSRLIDLDSFFTFISTSIGNPTSFYTLYFPAIYGFDSELGVKLLQATIFGDWSNQIMKWLLMGDRPYWWVHEVNLSEKIPIQQFYNTCETGPGNPSGHLAITGIAWFILAKAIIDKVEKKFKLNIKIVTWCLYIIAMTCLGLSRVYTAAHFPHQCLFGFGCAVIFGKIISDLNLDSLTLRHYLFIALFAFASINFVAFGLGVCGVDVNWTIRLAQQWCVKPEWVHMSTTPYYIMSRYIGVVIGVGLLTESQAYKKLRSLNGSLSIAMQTTISVCCLVLMSCLKPFTPFMVQHPAMYWVVCGFHAMLIYAVGVGVPNCLMHLGML